MCRMYKRSSFFMHHQFWSNQSSLYYTGLGNIKYLNSVNFKILSCVLLKYSSLRHFCFDEVNVCAITTTKYIQFWMSFISKNLNEKKRKFYKTIILIEMWSSILDSTDNHQMSQKLMDHQHYLQQNRKITQDYVGHFVSAGRASSFYLPRIYQPKLWRHTLRMCCLSCYPFWKSG